MVYHIRTRTHIQRDCRGDDGDVTTQHTKDSMGTSTSSSSSSYQHFLYTINYHNFYSFLLLAAGDLSYACMCVCVCVCEEVESVYIHIRRIRTSEQKYMISTLQPSI